MNGMQWNKMSIVGDKYTNVFVDVLGSKMVANPPIWQVLADFYLKQDVYYFYQIAVCILCLLLIINQNRCQKSFFLKAS